MSWKLNAVVKTLSGSTAETLGTGQVQGGCLIQADAGDVVYIGDSNVSTTTGFLVPQTPIKLADLFQNGKMDVYDLSLIYIRGASTDVVRLLYPVKV
jgi:hypothetical protein